VAGLTIIKALRQSNQQASLENTNLSAGVVRIAFFSRSRNRANCLQEQILSGQRRAAAPDTGEEIQTIADDRAQVPNETGKPGEDIEHPAIVSR
jgi:hypothetical protein